VDLGLVNPAVSIALDGLMMRQEAIANNVANMSTANYTATNVDFEGALKSALDMPSIGGTASTRSFMSTVASTAPAKQDGNNVSLEEQALLGTETNLRLNLALRAAEGRFNAVRDVLGGR
jgi:flagellar basal-body rod protein FlgB